jgi:hypothetical protein
MANLPKLPLRIAKNYSSDYNILDSDDSIIDVVWSTTLGGWAIPDGLAAAERRLAELTEMIEAATPAPAPRWTWERTPGYVALLRDGNPYAAFPREVANDQARRICDILNEDLS